MGRLEIDEAVGGGLYSGTIKYDDVSATKAVEAIDMELGNLDGIIDEIDDMINMSEQKIIDIQAEYEQSREVWLSAVAAAGF